jgi:hypothetical protein
VVVPITNFRAYWHPGKNAYGIDVRLQDGQELKLAVNTPEEFVAILALLNGPAPAMSYEGHVVSAR